MDSEKDDTLILIDGTARPNNSPAHSPSPPSPASTVSMPSTPSPPPQPSHLPPLLPQVPQLRRVRDSLARSPSSPSTASTVSMSPTPSPPPQPSHPPLLSPQVPQLRRVRDGPIERHRRHRYVLRMEYELGLTSHSGVSRRELHRFARHPLGRDNPALLPIRQMAKEKPKRRKERSYRLKESVTDWSKADSHCPICLETIPEGELQLISIVQCETCMKIFHRQCILDSLRKTKASCPTCTTTWPKISDDDK